MTNTPIDWLVVGIAVVGGLVVAIKVRDWLNQRDDSAQSTHDDFDKDEP